MTLTAGQPSATRAPRRWSEFAVEALVRIAGLSTIGFVLLIFFFLLREGIPAFTEVPLGNLFGTRWYPTFDLYGVLPLLLGSIVVTVDGHVDLAAVGVRA